MNPVPVSETARIKYCKGYKYQLREDFSIELHIPIDDDIITYFGSLIKNGDHKSICTIRKLFAWDGPSGLAIDDRYNARAALVHDFGYALMRMGFMPICCRRFWDAELERIMLLDRPNGGIWNWFGKVRAGYYRWAVEKFGEPCAKNAREILTAP